jgi:hypothetical protein
MLFAIGSPVAVASLWLLKIPPRQVWDFVITAHIVFLSLCWWHAGSLHSIGPPTWWYTVAGTAVGTVLIGEYVIARYGRDQASISVLP